MLGKNSVGRLGIGLPAIPMMLAMLAMLAITGVVAAGCAGEAPDADAAHGVDPVEYRSQIESWRSERDASLRKPDGWLTLAGLFWLEEGDNSFGGGAGNALVFPGGKIEESAGVLQRSGREVALIPGAGVVLTTGGSAVAGSTPLALDTADDGPTVIESGSLTFYAIERGDMIGVRLKDRESRTLAEFGGMTYFPLESAWRTTARYVEFEEPRILRTPNVLGTVSEEEIRGELQFEIRGKVYSLQPSGDPAEGFFLVFGDQTNGAETYGGGRFLYTEAVNPDGTVVVDFNRAYSPPCVFTPYATCPLPPAANKLPLRVEAGEKMFGAAH